MIHSAVAWSLKHLLIAALLVALSLSFTAQEPGVAAAGQAASSQSSGILKVVSREVVVDVVVTGRKMQPVRGLKAEDFEILEDDKPQRIVSFTVHDLVPPPAGLPKMPRPPESVYGNFDPVPPNSPLNVILIDLENTPRLDVPYVRDQISQFLRAEPEEARYAIFVMGGGMLSMIQGFTSDKTKLIAALNMKELFSLNFAQSVDPFTFRGAGIAPEAMFDSELSGAAAPWDRPGAPGVLTGSANIQAEQKYGNASSVLPPVISPEAHALLAAQEEFSNREQVGDTASELAQLSGFLRGLPGRKNLLWFSGSFPIAYNNLLHVSNAVRTAEELERQQNNQRHDGPVAPPDYSAGTGAVTVNNGSTVKNLGRLLAGSRTSVFAIDSRGLETISPNDAAGRAALAEQYAEQTTLNKLAKETGGRAFYNTNGFKEALSSALSEGTDYYTLSYSPTNSHFDGGWRNIRVILRNHAAGQVHLAYERGYFATSMNGMGEGALNSLDFTLQHGAPPAQQIYFWATVQPIGAPYPAPAKQDRVAAPSPSAGKRERRQPKSHPEVLQNYAIGYSVVPSMIRFDSPGLDKHSVNLEFAVRGYDSTGRETAHYTGKANGNISQASFLTIKQKGLRLSQKLALPTETTWLRLAVYDSISGRVGSLEVRLTPPSIRKTPKATAPAAP